MIAGDAIMPKPGGGTETGHSGDGYAIISWISPSL
ncbi:glycine rich domain-containing protein [Segatella albensis]|nr:glycine rich domain-containing protein [Segatella albensis]